jgi:hypothetical protein
MAFDYSVAHIQLSLVKSRAKTLKPIVKSSHDGTLCFTVAVEVIILKAGESDVLLQKGAYTMTCLFVSFVIVIRRHLFLFIIKHVDSFWFRFDMCLVLFFMIRMKGAV